VFVCGQALGLLNWGALSQKTVFRKRLDIPNPLKKNAIERIRYPDRCSSEVGAFFTNERGSEGRQRIEAYTGRNHE
jgi:hypothetical protein